MTLQPKNANAMLRTRRYTGECKHIAAMRQDDQNHPNLWLSRVQAANGETITVLGCGKCAKKIDGLTIARTPFALMLPKDIIESTRALLKLGCKFQALTETGRKLLEQAKTAVAA